MSDNVTPIPAPKAAKPKPGPKDTAQDIARSLDRIGRKVHVTFCTLECATAGLQKAEDEDDGDRWVRAARVVQRCCEDLKSIRDDVDNVSGMASRHAQEVDHG